MRVARWFVLREDRSAAAMTHESAPGMPLAVVVLG